MTKYSAFGTSLGIGTRQVETATIVGTITGDGDATVTVTATGMTGTPIAIPVAVLDGDTAEEIAEKIRIKLATVGNLTAKYEVGGSGIYVTLTALTALANVADLNIAVENDTCTGITEDTTSDDTIAGVANATIAQIQTISGAALSLDTEDVTTHDSTEGWEDVVATVLRTGELSFDIVYDPAETTHSATAGLLDYKENRKLAFFTLTFPDATVWQFSGYVVGFEPDMPHDGALTAAVTVKITGKPTLA